LGEAQPCKDFARTAFQTITVKLFVTCLNLPVAFDDLIHLVQTVRIDHRCFKFTEFSSNDAYRARPLHYLGHGAASGHFSDVLAKISDRNVLFRSNLSFIGLLGTGDHPEEGRLACTVRADKPDLLTTVQG